MRRVVRVLAALCFSSCTCAPAEGLIFACRSSDECVPGFVCAGGSCQSLSAVDGSVPVDSGVDGGPDPEGDAGADGGTGADAGTDAGADGGTDAGADAGRDGGIDAGPVDAGAPNGSSCTAGTQCASRSCSDGRCCDMACTSACDLCNLPGLEGRCTIAPVGYQPAVPCGGRLACDGLGAQCPTMCREDAGCVASRCGAGGVCIPPTSVIRDDFNGATLNPGRWGSIPPACSVQSDQLNIVLAPTQVQFHDLVSRERFNFVDSELRMELVEPGNSTFPTLLAYFRACVSGSYRCVSTVVSGDHMFLQIDDGIITQPIGFHPLGNYRRLRMRESGGALILEVRGDAGTYLPVGATATPFRSELADVQVHIGAATYSPEDSGTVVIWDNLNVP